MHDTGVTQTKVWGTTRCVYRGNNVEVHTIEAKAGGYCSKHIHQFKWNRFVVQTGRLKVSLYRPSGIEDVTIVGPGEMTDVAPGQYHRFEALEDTSALEVYWVNLEVPDILREDNGGQREPV